MDPVLAFIMSNMAKVKDNNFVFDPFVGSGSLLVSSAQFGAYVLGADLDFNLLHARGKLETLIFHFYCLILKVRLVDITKNIEKKKNQYSII